jgi:hypothetical protein
MYYKGTLIAHPNDRDVVYKHLSANDMASSVATVTTYQGNACFQEATPPDMFEMSGVGVIVAGNMVNVFLKLSMSQTFEHYEPILITTVNPKIPRPYGWVTSAMSLLQLSFQIDTDGQIYAISPGDVQWGGLDGYVSFCYIGNPDSLG